MNERVREHKLAAHERPKHVYEYYVSGTGEFPWDMLRYDAAWPADSTEASKLGVGFWDRDDAFCKVRSIKLRSYRPPTIGRWSSFTWSVGLQDLSGPRCTALCLLTAEEKKNFDPNDFKDKMIAAGFLFDSTTCPVKIRQPWDRIEQDDGSVLYRQWDAPLD